MILDLRNKTVTFVSDGESVEILTVDQLWKIIDLLDPDLLDDFVLNSETEPDDEVHVVFQVPSYKTDKTYAVVMFKDGSWACSCPDWLHRRSETGEPCKHIRRVSWMV